MTIRLLKPILSLAVVALFFASCKGDDTTPNVEKQYGKIQVFHAAIDAPAIDFQVDSKKINTDSLVYSKGTTYYDALLTTGKKNVYKVTTAKTGQSITTDSLTMTTKDVGYSVFIYKDKDAAKTIRTLYGPDNLLAPSAGNAKVRLVFLIPDFFSNGADIQVVTPGSESTSTSQFKDITFPKIADYINLPKGTYDVKVKIAGETKSQITFTNVTIEEGKIYTLVARGLFNVATTVTNNRGPALSVITNK